MKTGGCQGTCHVTQSEASDFVVIWLSVWSIGLCGLLTVSLKWTLSF